MNLTLLHPLFISTILLAVSSLLQSAIAAEPEIVEIQGGNVFVQQTGQSGYRIGFRGLELRSGDVVLPGPRTRVTVRCRPQANPRPVPRRLALSQICPDLVRSTDSRNDADFLALLAGDFPYVTQLLPETSTLRWPALPGETVYQVQLLALEPLQPASDDPFEILPPALVETLLWEMETTETAIAYSGSALSPNGRYTLRVSRAETIYELPLQPLAAAPLARVQTTVADLNAQTVTEIEQALALGYLYEEVGLYWQAIAVLEPLSDRAELGATEHQLLANCYLRTAAYQAAAQHYETAIALAVQTGDTLTQAAAYVGLAKAAAATQDRGLAAQYLRRSLVYYRLLQDTEWIRTIETQWLTAVAPPLNGQ
ncbi:hypothetical protein [Almyronema epifaneia]|uniref:hypothetical protein n=1 Tax=Almyronema epifaneia TaxID=3114805 RepID=UPI003671FEA8